MHALILTYAHALIHIYLHTCIHIHIYTKQAPEKKKLNIPICDVQEDANYELNIKPTYQLSETYIRYSIKLGEENNDIMSIYLVDEDDKKWLNANENLHKNDDVRPYVTIELMEKIINYFEISTDMNTNCISLLDVEKKILGDDQFQIYPLKALKVMITELYRYWVNKRKYLDKPLVRRYWPVTSFNDTNPHACFRPREKGTI